MNQQLLSGNWYIERTCKKISLFEIIYYNRMRATLNIAPFGIQILTKTECFFSSFFHLSFALIAFGDHSSHLAYQIVRKSGAKTRPFSPFSRRCLSNARRLPAKTEARPQYDLDTGQISNVYKVRPDTFLWSEESGLSLSHCVACELRLR